MVITLESNICESIDNILYEAEVFALTTTHKMRMDEASNTNKEDMVEKIKKYKLTLKRKIQEIFQKAVQAVNELIYKFYISIEDKLYKMKSLSKDKYKDIVEKTMSEYTHQYFENNKYYDVPDASNFSKILSDLGPDKSVSDYMKEFDITDKIRTSLDFSLIDWFDRSFDYKKYQKEELTRFKTCRDKLVKIVNDPNIKVFQNRDDSVAKTSGDMVEEIAVFKAGMNLYTAYLKCSIANVRARVAIVKKALSEIFKRYMGSGLEIELVYYDKPNK